MTYGVQQRRWGAVHGMANANGGDRGCLARSQPALAGVKRKHGGGGAGGAASIKSFFGPKDVGKKPTSAASADTNPPPDVPIDLGTRDVPAQGTELRRLLHQSRQSRRGKRYRREWRRRNAGGMDFHARCER